MADIPLSYDSSHLDQLSALKAEQRALAELSTRAAAHRDKVAEVYARVVRDYEARIQALEGQAETLRQVVHGEFVTLDEAYADAGRLLDRTRFELQENEFRRDIGEFSGAEFDRRVAAIEQEIVERQRERDRIGSLRQQYLNLLPSLAAGSSTVGTAVTTVSATAPEPPAKTLTPQRAAAPTEEPAVAAPPFVAAAPVRATEPLPEPDAVVESAFAATPVPEPDAAPAAMLEPEPVAPPVLPGGSFAGLSLPEPLPTPPPLPTVPSPFGGFGPAEAAVEEAVTGATRIATPEPRDSGSTRVLAGDGELNTGATRIAGGDAAEAGGTVMLPDAGGGSGDTRIMPDEGAEEGGSTRLLNPSMATAAVPVATATAYLLVEQRADGSTVEHLLDEHTTIGRWSGNEVVLNSHEVSRRHAEIVREGDTVTLRDYKTPNRTYVNDEPVLECQLRDGDRIAIGTHLFVFRAR